MDTIEITSKGKAVKVLFITDLHLSPYDPPSFKIPYWIYVQSILMQIFKWANVNDIDIIVVGGDVFHLKSASRHPLWFMTEAIQLMKSSQVPIVGIFGNHDLTSGTIKHGTETQPLSVLIAAGVYSLLDSTQYLVVAGETRVRIAGASYEHSTVDPIKSIQKQDGEILVSTGHFWFTPGPTSTFYGEVAHGPDSLHDCSTDVFLIGHRHDDNGHITVAGKHYICPGSTIKTGGHAHDIDRVPYAVLLEFPSSDPAEMVMTPIRPATPLPNEMFDLTRHQQQVAEKKELKKFSESLKEAYVDDGDMSPANILKAMDMPNIIRARVEGYLEDA